ncbi:MAG: hypothetical protein K2X74_15345 [Acetobacteraceae bacterium]|nr:hypothetical protein [Acetobacteraceae bacterium]
MYLGSSPSPGDALRQIRHSRYAAAFLAQTPFAQFWLHDLRAHTALALIMARAAAAAMAPAALTRRGVSDLTNLSMSAVHALLAEACNRGDFQRNADAGDRRRVMLSPTPATTTIFTGLVHDFLVTANGDALHPAVAKAAAQEPTILSLYARFACALVAARRPGGRIWVQPAALAMLADLMTVGQDGARTDLLLDASVHRGVVRATASENILFSAMAGLAETTTDGRVRLSGEGRQYVTEHLEIWRTWSSEARFALAAIAAPISTRTA